MDSETGLYYLSARFYDPELGRFTQEDDWLTEGPNLYIYCKNNPILFSDPSGHCNAYDLVYYRQKGDIATLEKLKRIIVQGGCDSRYHHDPTEQPDEYIIPDEYLYFMDPTTIRAQLNYRNNIQYGFFGVPIYNQNEGYASKLKFGAITMKDNGCEIIAMYNASVLLNRPLSIQKIAYDMEYKGIMLFGLFGTDPGVIGPYMASQGFKVKVIGRNDIDSCTKKGTVFIISFWNDKINIFEGLHTIAILCNGKNCFTTFNRWADSTKDDPVLKDVKSILRNGRWIVGYQISIK